MQESIAVGSPTSLPAPFIKRRLHSLTGFFLVLFLFEHLFTNSQAALFFGDYGNGFVQAVNFIQSLPYLPVIELTLIAVPMLLHTWWGIQYLYSAEPNSYKTDGSTAALPNYRPNHAYTWQRITAIILVGGILFHVVSMRFINYPSESMNGIIKEYRVRISSDATLPTLAARLGCRLDYQSNAVIVNAPTFGAAVLLTVRDSFKSLWTCFFYTLFVLAASFHSMNGLWTFAISWGITLSKSSQRGMRLFSNCIMFLITLLGLAAIWGTYWISLC